jgi:hypothetical protein
MFLTMLAEHYFYFLSEKPCKYLLQSFDMLVIFCILHFLECFILQFLEFYFKKKLLDRNQNLEFLFVFIIMIYKNCMIYK